MQDNQSLKNGPGLDGRKGKSENVGETELVSGVAWSRIKNIPVNWKVKNLEQNIDLQTGNNFSSDNFVDTGGLPLIRIRDLSEGETETNYEGVFDEKYVVSSNDLLVGMDGEFKPYLWNGETALLNQRILKIESDKYNKYFLRYALEKPLKYIQKSISGTTVKHLSQKNVKQINLPTPETEEQRCIASVLYNVDRAIQKTEEIIEQTRRVKKGVMQDLMFEGVGDEELSETDSRYGKIPGGWSIETIKNIGIVAGRTAPEKKDDEYWGGDIPWVTPSEITELEGLTISETENHITELALEEVSSNLLPPKSLLLTTRATIGECAINTVPMTTNQGFKNVVPNDDIDIWYLYYRMEHESNYLASLSKGSTFPEVGKQTVENFEIPIPTIDEQKRIGEICRNLDRYIMKQNDYKRRLTALRSGLMQDLLTGKVRTHDKDIEVLDDIKEKE